MGVKPILPHWQCGVQSSTPISHISQAVRLPRNLTALCVCA